MRFVTGLALAVAALVVLPWIAHRLRRRRADERSFAPAKLVPPAPPRARRRSHIEDQALFWIRAVSIAALAVLGASPLVRCSRLSLNREEGASVALAIVIDDSMSMRAAPAGGASGTRFERAMRGARELLASSREGDAIALVLAGAPARVSLAATTDLTAARAALDTITPSDRATDLDGSIAMARALVAQLPQVDKRVVLFSDLADGKPDAPPVGASAALPVWIPLAELRGDAADCGLLAAERSGTHVRVRVACGHGATSTGRSIVLRVGDKTLASAPAPTGSSGEVSIALSDAPADLVAHLEGADAIASDDSALVLDQVTAPAIAVVADAPDETAATGGAPVIEQALSALALGVAVRPLPAVPDRVEDLAPFVGVLIDDPPGFTPEQRRALAAFMEGGGDVLVALGPRAASAPLGASLEPVVAHAVAWRTSGAKGATVDGAGASFGEAAASLVDLHAASRASLDPNDATAFETLVAWDDHAGPLIGRRTVGRGSAWITTLPFSIRASDLTLRPGFLATLAAWVGDASGRSAPLRTDVGAPWTFSDRDVSVVGPEGPLAVTRANDGDVVARAVPPVIGAYRVTAGSKTQTRVAAPIATEMDLRPRAAAPSAASEALGESRASVDVSWVIALVLLALLAGELGLRVRRARAPEPA